MKHRLLRSGVFAFFLSSLSAQPHVGVRFFSDFHRFVHSQSLPLIQGFFSTGGIGPYVKFYRWNGGVELGVQLLYKQQRDLVNLPYVMADFRSENNTAWTSVEMDFRFGPRFRYFEPKTGYRLGYRFKQEGFQLASSQPYEENRWYITLPIGFSISLPTQFGTTGASFFYNIGLSNYLHRPEGVVGDFNGGRIHSILAEIYVTIGPPLK
jgi:hypothetical protein